MRRLLAITLLSLAATACSEDEAGFDVAIIAEPTSGNAPLTVQLRSRDNGPLDHSYTWRWVFNGGDESSESEPSHTFTQPGVYRISLEMTDVDSGKRATAALDVEALPSADLAVDEINFSPSQARPGQTLNLNWRLRNLGADVLGEWRLVAFVSRDQLLDEDDPQIELRRANDPKGISETLEGQIPLPDEMDSGDYFIGVVADPEGAIGDADKANNLAFGAIQLELRDPSDVGPNLTLCGLAIPAFDGVPFGETPTVARGEQLDATVCLGNTGNRPVIGASFTLYLSDDPTLDEGDLVVGQRGEIALGVGDRQEFDEVVDLPFDLPEGAYHLIALADPDEAIAEQVEEDNLRAWPDPFDVVEPDAVEGVDLVLRALTLEDDGAYWGQSLRGEVLLENRGDTPVERLFVLRLLADPIGDAEGVQLRSENVAGLPAGEALTIPLELPITQRVEPGEYRLTAVVDPTNSTRDVNLANNTRTLQDVLLLGGAPDLDPTVTEISFDTTIIEAGGTLNVQGRVKNLGLDETGPLDAVFFLSVDDAFDAEDVILERVPLDPIEGGASVPLQRAVIVPEDLDRQIPQFWVGLAVDPENRLQGERDEENNAMISLEPLRVTGATGGCAEDRFEPNNQERSARFLDGPLWDLGACDEADYFRIIIPPLQVMLVEATWEAEAGDIRMTLTVPEVLDEEGGVSSEAETHVVAGAEGRALAAVTASPAEREAILLIESNAEMPYALGIGLEAPPDGPDLMPRNLRPVPALVRGGSQVELHMDLVNLGNAAAGEGLVRARLEGSSLQAPLPLTELPSPSLEGGASAQLRATISLPDPLEDGAYTLVVVADAEGAVEEANEENNEARAPLVASAEQACQSDDLEPNGSPFEEGGAVVSAAAFGEGIAEPLYACRADDDWYQLDAEEGERVDIRINFENDEGDLDMALYAADGETLIAESVGLQDRESLSILRADPGPYFLRVYLNPGDAFHAANAYRLEITRRPLSACEDDDYEPNPTRVDSALLPDGRHTLALCPGDEDWFRFNIAAGTVVSFNAAAGASDILMTLFDPNNEVIGESARRITHEALDNGEHTLRLTSAETDAVIYELEVGGVSGLDLSVAAAQVDPAEAPPGADLRLRFEVENLRGDAVEGVPFEIYLSNDAELDAADRPLTAGVIEAVGGAARVTVEPRLSVPREIALGDVYLIVALDPQRTLPDLRPSNNALSLPFSITPACVDDDERTNEGPRTAEFIGDDPDQELKDRVICPYTEDWYSLEAPAGELAVELSFSHAEGDLDLEIYLEEGPTLIGESRTEGNLERASVLFDAPTPILIRVDGFFDAANTYNLSWEVQ